MPDLTVLSTDSEVNMQWPDLMKSRFGATNGIWKFRLGKRSECIFFEWREGGDINKEKKIENGKNKKKERMGLEILSYGK